VYVFLTMHLGLKIPTHDVPLAIGAIAAVALTIVSWRQLRGKESKGALGRGCRELFTRLSVGTLFSPSTSPPASAPHFLVERQLARFQLLSACFVALCPRLQRCRVRLLLLLRSPYIYHFRQRSLKWPHHLDSCSGRRWYRHGLAIWGKKSHRDYWEGINPLSPVVVSAPNWQPPLRSWLPPGWSHLSPPLMLSSAALLGLVESSIQVNSIQNRSVAWAWLITMPISAGLGASIFTVARLLFL